MFLKRDSNNVIKYSCGCSKLKNSGCKNTQYALSILYLYTTVTPGGFTKICTQYIPHPVKITVLLPHTPLKIAL